jgi:dihydroorotate dehydrogenase (fumarate)
MDLSTQYLGLKLRNPLVLSSSPLTEDLDNFRKAEDAGLSAIVMHSLFEEQIIQEDQEIGHNLSKGTDSFAESLTYYPEPQEFRLGPDAYLEQIRKAKKAVKIPIIASLNASSDGGWTKYAKLMESAGADAIELNVYFLSTDPQWNSDQIENTYEQILRSVKSRVNIPVAVKMHPFFSSLAYMAKCLDEAGADGLVLLNRFYQPDIDIETLDVMPQVLLSSPADKLLPLRWISILHGKVKASIAATSGIATAGDVIKMVMAGADAVMLCSVLLKNGLAHTGKILKDIQEWMGSHDYETVQQLKGILSHEKVADPMAFERANYMKVLKSYKW